MVWSIMPDGIWQLWCNWRMAVLFNGGITLMEVIPFINQRRAMLGQSPGPG
jgi:hypothetical protein